MNTRLRSIERVWIMCSAMCRIESASPWSRSLSPRWNQLKQPLGLLARCCSGKSRRI